MKKLIVVADWAADGLTSQQVRSTIEGYLQHNDNPNINFIPVSFSTLHGGFVSSQVIEIEERNGRPLDTVLYVGVDPKEADTFSAIFMIARLKSGLIICGPNNGLNFSFIKQKIDEIFIYKGLEEKMFFRSRDLYARVIAHLMEAMEDEMDIEETHTNLIPALEGFFVGHIDNFGNIITTVTQEDVKGKLEIGDETKIKINEVVVTARFLDILTKGNEGSLILSPSPYGAKDNPFLQLSVLNISQQEENSIKNTAAAIFGCKMPGYKLQFS
ncbi:hypothetical protein A2966_01665 [Candidatus Roizmanbacteria bacterium RIFCSPLOWO2_01_FULL_41_22]|uniref:Uncharacterized protein n=2 Tax=Candidatus Roizmaniibacteriota TaxID=1752723 RepID=A0A1F7JQI3_9BACT|nr:MAG: hypothetical protein A2966_01665 [Candidatus Roizmanbacteria bacterium RIFCSPLOWO2_01_FULL_41_22]OGK57866.1 MAG: hypothetical protein A3H86_03925 [Candidatus Roizmanbacteria bacterium RIFCSPLOWO2_02_FULL_41_9]